VNERILKLHNKYQQLISIENEINESFYNGVLTRYKNPVITSEHVPLNWRYDLNQQTNPLIIERLGVNAVFNPGAIEFENCIHLVVRVEGSDRKSFFAMAKSKNGIDQFEFYGYPLTWDDMDQEEVNMYDMRLTKHEDGYIYGVYCSESKDKNAQDGDTSSAIAKAALVRTKDLVRWERLKNLITPSKQQRNVCLHPTFIDGKYAFYTRPQDGFIETGSGGGISIGLVDDIMNPVIYSEKVIDAKKYHTIYELKNGQGPTPLKGDKGWIHIAHGVRQTASGLRYVLYAFATSFQNPYEVIAKPSGYLLAPYENERIGDVSNVLFCNGAVLKEDGKIFIYYASSDTRIHVATTTLERLEDYLYKNPKEAFRSLDCAKQRIQLIKDNEKR
jgi:4-O-beta-D-mannosyl-D-glucose phosphorylase